MAECVGWVHIASDTYLESTNLYNPPPKKKINTQKCINHQLIQVIRDSYSFFKLIVLNRLIIIVYKIMFNRFTTLILQYML